MRRQFWIVLAGAAAAMILIGQSNADQPKNQAKVTDPWAMLGTQLNLDAQQQQQLRQITDEFRKKAEPARQQVRQLRHQEMQAVQAVLTEEQKKQLPQALHTMWDKEWQTIGARLKLTEQQKQDIAKIRDEFGKKFHDMAKQTPADMSEKAGELKTEFFTAIDNELNPQQRAELPVVLHEEFGQWKNKEFRQQHLKALGEQLKLTDAQKQQIEKVHTDFGPKLQGPMDQLKKLHEQEFDAVEKILKPEQRTKLHDLLGERPAQQSPAPAK